jgi:large subunit ribosomal protein L4e
MFWVGATSPQTRGGRRSHPPKSEKNFAQEINKKENRKAIRSALAAVINKDIVLARGHKAPELYPFIIDSSLEQIKSTREAEKILVSLGFGDELKRTLFKKVRAGIGKLRGRKYKRKKGLLIVVGDDCPIQKAAANIPGLTITAVSSLNAEILAPGALPGRVTLWTESAIKKLNENKLFI